MCCPDHPAKIECLFQVFSRGRGRGCSRLWFPLVFVSCVAHHTCGGQEMIALRESGLGTGEVNNNCTGYEIPDGLLKIA